MSNLKYRAIGAAFETLSLSGLPRLIRRQSAAKGVIFTLHRVLPEAPQPFSPNAILQVTPDFLETVIEKVRALGFDWLSLDDALERLSPSGAGQRPFAVLTFDDAYRDNLIHALPILQKHNCPFTLYVPTALVDGKGEIWWQALEDIIAANNSIVVDGADVPTFDLVAKQAVFDKLYWQMREMPEEDRVRLIHQLAGDHGVSLFAHCRQLIMDWDELDAFVKEPLCTLGAHTVHHYELSKLTRDGMRAEIANSVSIIRQKTGIEPQHLSYPIGSTRAAGEREYKMAAALGLKSGVTTIPGGLYAHHAEDMMALPRISLNGYYQKKRYVDVYLTGALFTALSKYIG